MLPWAAGELRSLQTQEQRQQSTWSSSGCSTCHTHPVPRRGAGGLTLAKWEQEHLRVLNTQLPSFPDPTSRPARGQSLLCDTLGDPAPSETDGPSPASLLPVPAQPPRVEGEASLLRPSHVQCQPLPRTGASPRGWLQRCLAPQHQRCQWHLPSPTEPQSQPRPSLSGRP